MSKHATNNESISKPEPMAGPTKQPRKAGKKAKPAKKAGRGKKAATKAKVDRASKKADSLR